MNLASAAATAASYRDRFDRPILIISPPRSGSTLLFETLSKAPGLYSVGGESHGVIEQFEQFHPARRGWTSNRLTADDASPEAAEQLARAFYGWLRDRDGRPATTRVRMLEKTPKNALRVPFFEAIWPDTMYIYLYRDVRQSLSSMMEAWLSGGFRTYPRLPKWQGLAWSLLLVPGWQELNGRPLQQIVARQWAATTEILLDDLAQIPKERLRGLSYDDFLASPQSSIERLAGSLGLSWDKELGSELPLSRATVSRPSADKWRAIVHLIEEVWPTVERVDSRAREFVQSLTK